MDTEAIEDLLAKRFRVERPPTLVARTVSKAPIVFSRLRSAQAVRGRSMSVPREDAFTFQVPLSMPFFSGLWQAGKHLPQSPVALGDAFLFDLSNNPTVGLNNPFDSLRFYIPRATLDELAYDRGLPPDWRASCSDVWRPRHGSVRPSPGAYCGHGATRRRHRPVR
ncbi:MAG: hypothetical protein WDN49_13585 [Acetobacteraceae bacterium]